VSLPPRLRDQRTRGYSHRFGELSRRVGEIASFAILAGSLADGRRSETGPEAEDERAIMDRRIRTPAEPSAASVTATGPSQRPIS
jgi:hypothetical protein